MCAWTAYAVVVGGCRTASTPISRPKPPIAATTTPAALPAGRPATKIDTKAGDDGALVLALGDGGVPPADISASVLTPQQTEALFARAEALPKLDNANAPIVRPPSAAPPRTGGIAPIAFEALTGTVIADKPVSPHADKPPGVVALAAPQILPDGEVERESEVRVRFTEPMVPVAEVGESKTPVATLSPSVAGTWRWIDTRVAQFTAASRLPGSTEFTVTVPKGTKAVSGAVLQTEVTGKFMTTPIEIRGTYPPNTLRPDSAIVVEFDQKVDPAQIVKFLRVEDGKKHKLAFTATTLDAAKKSWKRNPTITHDDKNLASSYIVIAPKTYWPPGAHGRVVLANKAPSLEGPRTSTEETAAEFYIAPTFVVRGIACPRVEKPRMTGAACPANNYVSVVFSNPIEPSTYRAKKIQIAGERFYDHEVSNDNVMLESPLKVGGSYTISVGDGIEDIYAQPLVGGRELSFVTNREIYEPELNARGGMYTLDPRYEIPQWVVNTQAIAKLDIELYQVQPADYFAFQKLERREVKTLPGKRMYQKQYAVGPRHSAVARVDLRPALPDGTGHVIAVATVTPAAGTLKAEYERRIVAWIQVTKIGLTARMDGERLHAWTHDITPSRFLAPIPNVQLSLLVDGRSDAPPPVTGNAEGYAVTELLPYIEAKPGQPRVPHSSLVVAKNGNDSAFTDIYGRYEKSQRHEDTRWYVTDDRFTYKPGEPVYVKGWVRWIDDGINPALRLPKPGENVTYTFDDSRGNRVASGTANLSKDGGFDITVNLPANVNLGTAMFHLETARGQSYRHAISVEEFRTPAYAVTLDDDVQFSGAKPLILGETLNMNVEAKYYAGGGMGGAAINWQARMQTVQYDPPGWDRYTFAPARPRSERNYYDDRRGFASTSASETGTLSGASTSALSIGIAAMPLAGPALLEVDANVTDIDRQTIRATSRKILVHPASLYVGIRRKPDSRDLLELVVTDIDGNLVPNVNIDVAIEGVLGSERYRKDAEIVDQQSCKVTSASTPVTCRFTRQDDKTAYTALASIKDPAGRVNVSQFDIPWWTYSDRDLEITPDKQTYKPGDVAKLTITSKVTPAIAVVTFARNGVIAQKRVDLSSGTATVELPIEVAYLVNVKVLVDRAGKRRHQSEDTKVPATQLPLPESDYVEIDLPVDVSAARLSMRTRPLQPLIEPGDEASFEVEVKHDDKPVQGAEVALIVVDEAVLAISGRQYADPLEPFYASVGAGTWRTDNLRSVQDAGSWLGKQPGFDRVSLDTGERHSYGYGSGYGVGGGRGGMRGRSASMPSSGAVIKVRKDFRPNAVFSPRLETDANGKVKVTVKMPDSLTRYRIVALATAKTGFFGKAESNIVAQLKVNARTVAPRFLTTGDTFSVPVVVQNLDTKPRTVDVAVRAANLRATGPQGKRVVVPGGDRAEVRFDFATMTRGKAVIQTVASSGTFADASNVEIPVYEPATTESFATYGSVTDKPVFEQLKIPADVFPEVGGIEAELSSTQLQNLTDAYWYLYAYPFECAEQRSSRMIATTAMYDIVEAFALGRHPTKQQIADQRAFDARKLRRDQLADGGWGYFPGMDSDPFVTMQVLTALSLQGEKGSVVDNASTYVNKRFMALLTDLEKAVAARDVKLKHRPDDAANVSLAAMALTALAAGKRDVMPRALRLHSAATSLGSYPVDAKARLLAIMAGKPAQKKVRAKLLSDLLSAVHETAAAATVTSSFTDAEKLILASDTRTTSLTLDALLREQPDHALIPKLARGLLDSRRRGRWLTTQDNLNVLLAVRRYFDIYEKETPNFTGKLWLGTTAYVERQFAGRTMDRGVTNLDWLALKPGTTHEIAIERSGTGRMYYRFGITYAPKNTNLPPLDAGFVVRRSYKAVDNPSDVVQQPDGTWRVKLGARVLVQLEVLNTSDRHAVALVDPLPAGFEAVNTRLATAERAVVDADASSWDYTAMRDNRSEVFDMNLAAGSHHFSYTARATTPGTFITAPAKAEEMYSPETFGRSAGTTVAVQ